MSQDHRHENPRLLAGGGFARWRQLRPFWAGVFLALGGVLTGWWTLAPFSRTFSTGLGDNSSTILMILLVAGGVGVWIAPQRRRPVGVIGMAIGVFSIVTAHLGGLIAALATLVGGAMALSWVAPRSLDQATPRSLDQATPPSVDQTAPDVREPTPVSLVVPAVEPPVVVAPVPSIVPAVAVSPPAAPRATPLSLVAADVRSEPEPATPTPMRTPSPVFDETPLPPPVAMPLLLPPPVPVEVRWPTSED